jgi:type II secretory pathway pseudopilin PulG
MSPLVLTLVIIVVGLVLLLGVLTALLLPAVQSAREAARRAVCSNNLRGISLAILTYQDKYGHFPKASESPKPGQPAQSWRVAILPMMDLKAVYSQYDPSQPWNSAKNKTVAATPIPAYRCPSCSDIKPTETNYVMLVGKNFPAGEPGGKPWAAGMLSREQASTPMLVEVPGAAIPWAEPRDMTAAEVITQLKKPHRMIHFPGVVNMACADGSVHTTPVEGLVNLLQMMVSPGD